jgi:hypothetical protein
MPVIGQEDPSGEQKAQGTKQRAQRSPRPQPKFQISNSRSYGENESSDGESLHAAKKFTNSATGQPGALDSTSCPPKAAATKSKVAQTCSVGLRVLLGVLQRIGPQ